MKSKYLLFSCACILASAARAQTAPLEEVVVTAQKRSESLQDVPVAISAFTDKTRDLLGIQTLLDLTNFTPGITYSTSNDRMFMRGIGRYNNNLATAPGVATYGDGFYNYSNHQADQSTLFTERVEVLRGPQGTLYGRNSIGGAINVISKRPKDEWGGEVRAVGGNLERYSLEGNFWGPITDWMQFSLGGGRYRQDQGYIENIAGDDGAGRKDNNFAMGQLQMKFDSVDVWIKAAHTEWNEGHQSSVVRTPYATDLSRTTCPGTATYVSLICSGSVLPSSVFNTGPSGVVNGVTLPGLNPANPPYLIGNPGVNKNSRQINANISDTDTLYPDNQFLLEVVGHLGFADIKYLGGYHYYYYALTGDQDGTSRPFYDYTPPSNTNPVRVFTDLRSLYVENNRVYTNEVDLTSNGDGKLQWIAGVYQYYNHYDQPITAWNPNQPQLRTPLISTTLAPAAANPVGYYSYTDAEITNTSNAAFGQLDYNFTDTWKGTLGLRYTDDKKHGNEFYRLIYWDPTTLGARAPAVDLTASTVGARVGNPHLTTDGSGYWTRHLELDSHATSGTAGIEWQPEKGTLAYFHYTRGYKDAAVNAGSIAAVPYADPEFTDAFEVGWKTEFWNQLQFDTSVFYYKNKDTQIPLTLIPPVGVAQTQTFNIDSVSYGVEIETIWKATDALQIMLDYSYLNATLDDDNCYSDSLDVIKVGPKPCFGPANNVTGHRIDGNSVPGSPKNKVAFNALYTFNFQPGSLTLSGSYTWRDKVYSSVFTRPEWAAPSFEQTDLRATWTDIENRYSIVAYLRNAFDDFGYDGVSASINSAGIQRTENLTPPRQYGVELQYRFGSGTR